MSNVVQLKTTAPRDRALAEFKATWLDVCFNERQDTADKSRARDMLMVQYDLCKQFDITHAELIDLMGEAAAERLAKDFIGRFVAALTFTLLGIKP